MGMTNQATVQSVLSIEDYVVPANRAASAASQAWPLARVVQRQGFRHDGQPGLGLPRGAASAARQSAIWTRCAGRGRLKPQESCGAKASARAVLEGLRDTGCEWRPGSQTYPNPGRGLWRVLLSALSQCGSSLLQRGFPATS